MRLSRALNASAITGIAAFSGVAIVAYATAVVFRLAGGGSFPIPTPGHAGEILTGLALLLAICMSVSVVVFAPYAVVRARFSRPLIGDAVIHISLSLIIAALVATIFRGDVRAFLTAFGLFAAGGLAGITAFRFALRRSAHSIAWQPPQRG